MMDPADRSRLLEEFSQYLDDLAGPLADEAPDTDLFSLFSEIAALRTEVRTETRWFRATLDDLREAHGILRDNQGQIDQVLERLRNELSTQRRNTLRPLLLDLLDLHDRLAVGVEAHRRYLPVKGWFRIKSRPEDRRFIASFGEGQSMTLRRLEEILARQEVAPLPVLGLPADPHTMKVVELDQQPDQENGIVTAEVRRGFRWGEEVLRLAEVKVNKKGAQQ